MSNAVMDYYKQLPPWAKGVMVVGTGVVAFLIGNSIWGAVKQARNQAAALKESTNAASNLAQLAMAGVYPTMTDTQFEGFSNSLATAFGGCGTSTQDVYNVFAAMNNLADVFKLIATYGTRSYDGCRLLLEGTQNNTLSAALVSELSAGELSYVNNILQTKGIQYIFA